ncbi:MAG: tRNA pseudouridine(38-40) synthase TruA [Deltaproteobacteria bacterium]|nr:tRNA pseudouridine(38-40) synthase TruA [Deltaproteobacteria bacterium]
MPNTRNLKITLAYDGTGFLGWQTQSEGRTVQSTLEDALGKLFGHKARTIASGRTDTGVHALGQVVNVHTDSRIPVQGLLRALNAALHGEISIISVEEAPENFHARFMAKSKKYVYIIDTSPVPSPFIARYALHVDGWLDISAMKMSTAYILGEHDFSAFMGTGSSVKTTQRKIFSAEIFSRGPSIFFYIQGSGFLRHMVRNIVGTMLMIGKGKLPADDMGRILDGRDRSCAGPTAPPHGLYLIGVDYGDNHSVINGI